MIIFIECLILCLVFTGMVCIMMRNPIATLYNYPPKIQERVKSLEQYKGKIPTNKNKVWTKSLVALAIVVIFSLILRYINGYTTFKEAFIYSFVIWTIVNIYDAVVMDIIWFCHSKKAVLEGTEDMVKEYHDYMYHIKQSMIGEIIGASVCIIIGLVIHFVL